LDSELRPDLLLFHEGPSRVLVSTAQPEKVAALAANHGVEAPTVGVTIETEIEISRQRTLLGRWEIAALKLAYEQALESHVR
jgi:phosphoribosylformylglycinamidine synthase